MFYCRCERYNRKLPKNGGVIRTKYYPYRDWLAALMNMHQMRFLNNYSLLFRIIFLASKNASLINIERFLSEQEGKRKVIPKIYKLQTTPWMWRPLGGKSQITWKRITWGGIFWPSKETQEHKEGIAYHRNVGMWSGLRFIWKKPKHNKEAKIMRRCNLQDRWPYLALFTISL